MAEVKLNLRLDDFGSPPAHPDDLLVTRLITVAREHVERVTGRALRRQTWCLASDGFPQGGAPIALLRLPLIGVVSIVYCDATGSDVAFADYEVVADDFAACVFPATAWPSAMRRPNSVRVTYRAGYETGSPPVSSLPERLRQAMRVFVAQSYRRRDEPLDADSLNAIDNLLTDYTGWNL